MFNRTLILSILVAFIFQVLAYNLFLYTFTLLVKYEGKTGKAQWIEFTEQQYSKLKLNETEFTYNDNLYDIITSQKESGAIKLLCKIDAKEKDLLEKLIEGFKQNKAKKLISFSFMGEVAIVHGFLSKLTSYQTIKHTYFISSVLNKSLEKTIPPPKA